MERAKLTIEGMNCGHCVRAVSAALRDVPGVTVRGVEVGSAEVAYDAALATPEAIAAAVREEGYTVVDIGREP